MPTNWDELLNWGNIGFKPNYQEEQQPQQYDPLTQRRGNFGAVPEYDMNPMNRYKEYLGTEPSREQYKPGKFRNVVNSLSAGIESMESNLGRGTALYDALTERDYDNAYKSWANRATKYKADVDLENTRYKNASSDYDRVKDNERQNRSVDIAGQNANTNAERARIAGQQLALAERKYNEDGFDLVDGPNNKKVGVRIRGGQQEKIQTDIPNGNLTAEQRIEQFTTRENNEMTRFRNVSGNAALAAKTATDNTNTRIAAQLGEGERNRTVRAYENDKDREFDRWRHTTRSASMNGPIDRSNMATATNTPVEVVQNGFKGKFNHPDLVEIDPKNNVTVITEDKARVLRGLTDISKRTGVPLDELKREWLQEFVPKMKSFGGR